MANDVLPSQLAHSVMGKLYDVLTNGDDTVPRSEDNFFAWCTPAVPIEAKDFEFLTQGLTGVLKPSAVRTAAGAVGGGQSGQTAALTPEQVNQLLAQDVGQLYQQAEMFARLVDTIPDVSGIDNRFATLNVLNNEGSLSDCYEYILRFSQVMESQLPPETVKKIEKLRGLLSVKKKKKNLIDDTETEVEEASPLVQAYNEKLKAYEDAALEYNCHRINALTAADPRAVHFWAINANVLRNRVKAALNDWVTNGYKNDYEAIAAFIDQTMQRDMTLLKAEYREALEKAKLTGLASGSDFYYTALAPANWVKSSGWTQYTFESTDVSRYSNAASNKWASGGSFLGLVGGGGSGSRQTYKEKFDSHRFRLSFWITQLPILRPWLKTQFLVSKAWRFDQSNAVAKGEMVSDGGNPPKGKIPAYPTMLIAIKNLELHLGDASGVTEFMRKTTSGGGFASFAGFSLGGSYSSGKEARRMEYSAESQGIRVPGMQIIGYKCHVLPKSPDPLPTITSWV